jgi:hypothetical protein
MSFWRNTALIVYFSLAVPWHSVVADEGMWLFNNPPIKRLEEKYQFKPTEQWLEHLQKSSIRLGQIASASFVSADGLAITNAHAAAESLQELSDATHSYVADGFYAPTLAEEKPCLDLEFDVLMSIEDVTARVSSAVNAEMDSTQALVARRSAIAQIEKESEELTGLHSEVVTLFGGASYQLYRYKRYTDVRIVFAPQQQVAFFGGDPDNFEYPRFDFDICFLRAYENGHPAHTENYLRFNSEGPQENDLILTSGNPGHTNRQLTVAGLTTLRDRILPMEIQALNRLEVLIAAFGARKVENSRRLEDMLLEVRNDRKSAGGELAALLDPELFADRVRREQSLHLKLEGDARYKPALDSFGRIARAESEFTRQAETFYYYEGGNRPLGFNSQLFHIARTLVRDANERLKPNGDRLPEFRTSNQGPMELQLFSEAPIYDDIEELTLGDSLTDLVCRFGADDPLVQRILAGKTPQARAVELVSGSGLKDVSFRRELYGSKPEALEKCTDPMIALASLVEPVALAVRKSVDEEKETEEEAYAQIAAADLALEGQNTYPDATFTLRLSYGQISGYAAAGERVTAFTTFAGLYQRAAEHQNQAPFNLPQKWIDRKDRLCLETPLNFVSTDDAVGGSSGSPLVNQVGEFVGILFDGNLPSLIADFDYDDKQARSISVDSAAIREALTQVYDARALVKELNTGKSSETSP